MANYLTFSEIVTAVERATKNLKGSKEDLAKTVINQVYLNEIMCCDDLYPLFWMVDFNDSLSALGPTDISGISQADPGVVTTDEDHGLGAGDIVGIFNVVGMTEVNNRLFRVGTVGATTTFELATLDGADVSTAAYTAYSSGGKVLHYGVTLGTNIDEALRVAFHDEKVLTPASIMDIELDELIDDSEAVPDRCFHRKSFDGAGTEVDQILWFRGADQDYDVRLWLVNQADRLSADADAPKLPHRFHDAIVAGAIARLENAQPQVEQPSMWPRIYLEHLDAIRSFNRKWWARHEKAMIDDK